MAVFLKSKASVKAPIKQKTQEKNDLLTLSLREKLPGLNELQTKIKQVKATLAGFEAKWKTDIEAIYAFAEEIGLKPEETMTIFSLDETVFLTIGKEGNSRVIRDAEKVVEFLDAIEEGLAIKLAKFNLSDLDKYLSPKQLDQVLTSTPSGRRSIVIKGL